MANVGTEVEPPAEEKPEPAVPGRRPAARRSSAHLTVQHGLTPTQYRERFGLKPDYPMAAPRRRELALSIGLGRPKKPARRRRKSTARPKPPKPSQSATTKAARNSHVFRR